MEDMKKFMNAAIEEARKGLKEGGIPIGSVLVVDDKIVGRGHNQRCQKNSAVLHAEMDCFENAGPLKTAEYQRAVLYSTLSPCDMCSGTALLFKVKKIVMGENETFKGPEEYVRSRGVEIMNLENEECKAMLQSYIKDHPEVWSADICAWVS